MKKLILITILLLSVFENIFSYNWKGRMFVGSRKYSSYTYQLKDHFDTFKYGDRNLLLERYPMLVKRAGPDLVLEKNCEWYEFPFYSDIYIYVNNNIEYIEISDEVEFKIIHFIDKNEIIELDVVFNDYNGGAILECTEIDWPYMEDIESVHKIILKFDGDFIYVYVNNMSQLFHVYCKMYEQDRIRFNKCMATNNFDDLSEVIWPHHADGTSEYEDTIRYPDPIVIEEPEEIEIEEYVDETENSDNQLEKQQTRLEWLKENDPERYELEMYEIECMNKRERREKILKIVIPSSIVFVVFGIIFIILKKKKKSAK